MSTIRKTGSTAPRTPPKRAASGCDAPSRRPADLACGGGGWTAKTGKAGKQEKATHVHEKSPKSPQTVSSCGGGGWSRYGKIPSGC